MSQIKIYGLRERIQVDRSKLSDTIHACVVEALNFPADKRFHRFFPMEREDFIFPANRSDHYTIIEISMFEGRTIEAKKQLIRLLFQRIQAEIRIDPNDLEITIFETPRHHWGIRGQCGDELSLNYKVDV